MLGILHTTESDPGTGAATSSYLLRNGIEPHYVIDPSDGYLATLTYSGTYAKALTNLPGGVETNRREGGVIQVEIVGRAAECGGYDAVWYARLRDQLAEISLAHNIAWTFRPDPTRLTFTEWDDPSLTGWLGHCHVPENNHTDPGTLDYTQLTKGPDVPALQDDTQISFHPGGDRSAASQSTPITSAIGFTVDSAAQAEAVARQVLAVVQGLSPQAASIRSFPTTELLAELVRRQLA